MRRRDLIRLGVLFACTWSWFGCSSGSGSGDRPPVRTEIQIPVPLADEESDPFRGDPQPGADLVFALGHAVDPAHAPVPYNDSERMVFRNFYETLVEVDCAGEIHPGLAIRWESREDHRTWIFTLRNGVRFWDGSILQAADIKQSWIEVQHEPEPPGHHSPLIWLNARAKSVKVLDPRRLAITLPEPQMDFPLLLAHPALAVARSRPGWHWPVGTGPCHPAPEATVPDPDLVCLGHESHRQPPIWNSLTFRILPAADPRDILGSECDVLLVRERGELQYFERAPGIQTTPLPWDHLYLLLCPEEAPEVARQRWYTGWHRIDLARDVPAAAARPASAPFFQTPTEKLCPQLTGPVESLPWPKLSGDSRTVSFDEDLILYPESDPNAQHLAERLAALAAQPLRPGPQRPGRGALQPPNQPAPGALPEAMALSWPEIAGAVQSARAGAYVVPWTREYASACLQLAALLSSAQWLQTAALASTVHGGNYPPGVRAGNPRDDTDLAEVTEAANRLERRGVVVPLIVTRPFLVATGRLAGIRLAYDGTLLLSGAGWISQTGSRP
ncbi:MAG: ABC transporter substrate-binding protein [bacterium]